MMKLWASVDFSSAGGGALLLMGVSRVRREYGFQLRTNKNFRSSGKEDVLDHIAKRLGLKLLCQGGSTNLVMAIAGRKAGRYVHGFKSRIPKQVNKTQDPEAYI